MRSILVLLSAMLATPAFASDGVREINQTCAAQTGCFAGDAAGFPVTISAAGSYRLTGNLAVPNENTSGITIGISDVSVDLSGFSISGPVVCNGLTAICTPNSGTGSGVASTSPSFSGHSVRNGIVSGMGSYGVSLPGAQGEVTNVRARSNRLDGISVSFGSTATGNVAWRNGGSGIFAGGGSTVSGNTSSSNLSHGIETSPGCTVLGNSTRSNEEFGLSLGSQSGYRENVISANLGGTIAGTTLVNLGNNACNGSTTCP